MLEIYEGDPGGNFAAPIQAIRMLIWRSIQDYEIEGVSLESLESCHLSDQLDLISSHVIAIILERFSEDIRDIFQFSLDNPGLKNPSLLNDPLLDLRDRIAYVLRPWSTKASKRSNQ